MFASLMDLNTLSLLVGVKTELRRGKRTVKGLITGVFMVEQTGHSECDYVVEVTEHGRHHYATLSQLANDIRLRRNLDRAA
jgi:hypothetical protein